MSHLSKVFNSVPVKVPDRSGFDMSHENLFSAKVGTLIPASVEEVLPGDVVSIGGSMSVELPPLATNFKGRVDAKLEAFFVPNRILWAGWQDFICQDPNHKPIVPGFSVASVIPQVRLSGNYVGASTLSDYLGVKWPNAPSSNLTLDVNALPFLAYHKIWDDWYRDTLVQQPFFLDGLSSGDSIYIRSNSAPFSRDAGVFGSVNVSSWNGQYSPIGFNGKDMRSLNQRCFAKDYFTTMTTQPQSGADSELQFNVVIPDITDLTGNSTTGSGSFNIRSLRVANALQTWLEKNNIGGTRYYDQILAHFGVMPPDANVNRAVLLGAMTSPVVVNSISQTNQPTNGQTKNPYADSTGAQFGRGLSFGKDRLVDNFEVKEHGFIMILFSLVPHVYYSTGVRRYLGRSGSGTFAFPEFAGIGDQEVYQSESFPQTAISTGVLWDSSAISGYNQRFSEYKYHDDEVHGLLSSGQSLQSFVLQRGFGSPALPSSSLLEIPTNYMDDVMVTTSAVSGFNAIVDCYFDSKMLRVLPEYSLPHL